MEANDFLFTICEAIKNNSTIEGDDDDTLIFGEIKEVAMCETCAYVVTGEGKKFKITVSQV